MFPSKTLLKTVASGMLVVGLLTGCQLFRRSDLAVAVDQTRASVKRGQSLASVHRLLEERGVEHKIVQFRYEVSERPLVSPAPVPGGSLGESPLAFAKPRPQSRVRAGIVYRDEARAMDPWWYVDSEVRRAIWLPTDRLEWQLSFAMRRRVEVLRVQEFDRAVDGLTKQEPKLPATDWHAIFRARNGSEYDPKSPVDVAKMQALRSR